MPKYLYRTCSQCNDTLGVVVPEPPEPVEEIPTDATCLRCRYKPHWKTILGKRSPSTLTSHTG